MKVVQMTLDEELVKAVDQAVKRLRTNRSAFSRQALRDALKRVAVSRLERLHQKGYRAHPVEEDEFSVWEKEQDWGDE